MDFSINNIVIIMHFYQSFINDEAALSVLVSHTMAVDESPWYFFGAVFISLTYVYILLHKT